MGSNLFPYTPEETGAVSVDAVLMGAIVDHLRRGEHLVYRLLNDHAEAIYVGITASPGVRWRAHLRTKPWAAEVAEIYYTAGMSRHRALALEREAILDERPKYNRTVGH